MDSLILENITEGMKNAYNDKIYNITYINSILEAFEQDITEFSISKSYQIYNTIAKSFVSYYIIVINKKAVLEIDKNDIFRINSVYLKDEDTLSMKSNRMHPEAREKITAKYLQYICRLEDTLGIPYHEILAMELTG